MASKYSDGSFTQRVDIGKDTSGGIVEIRDGLLKNVGNIGHVRADRIHTIAGLYNGNNCGACRDFGAVEAVKHGAEHVAARIHFLNDIAATIN